MDWLPSERILGNNGNGKVTHKPHRPGKLPDARANRGVSVRSQPAWAKGLQRLYDEVVDEQLPQEFADLLNQLDHLPHAD